MFHAVEPRFDAANVSDEPMSSLSFWMPVPLAQRAQMARTRWPVGPVNPGL
jgi:hypothetical protein